MLKKCYAYRLRRHMCTATPFKQTSRPNFVYSCSNLLDKLFWPEPISMLLESILIWSMQIAKLLNVRLRPKLSWNLIAWSIFYRHQRGSDCSPDCPQMTLFIAHHGHNRIHVQSRFSRHVVFSLPLKYHHTFAYWIPNTLKSGWDHG